MEFSLDDLKTSAVRRMLMQAIRTDKNRSLPMHKRKGKEELASDEDEVTEEQDEEMEKLAELSEEKKGKALPVAMDDEDMSEEAMDELKPPKKKASKKK